VIVVNDARSLYDTILREAGFVIDERLKRHVNRRTGRRNREYFEEIIVARRYLNMELMLDRGLRRCPRAEQYRCVERSDCE
jgi:hypothetical protein